MNMKVNYFNKNIVENHDHLMYLNNSMAECYDFCLSVAVTLENIADQAWYYDQKRAHICYDV